MTLHIYTYWHCWEDSAGTKQKKSWSWESTVVKGTGMELEHKEESVNLTKIHLHMCGILKGEKNLKIYSTWVSGIFSYRTLSKGILLHLFFYSFWARLSLWWLELVGSGSQSQCWLEPLKPLKRLFCMPRFLPSASNIQSKWKISDLKLAIISLSPFKNDHPSWLILKF